MRVISQDGTIDVSYENFVFGITLDNYISAVMDTAVRPTEVVNGIMAKYSSREKALKAMEMLRTAYTCQFITNAELPEDFEKEMKKLMKGSFAVVRVRNSDNYVEFNNLNGYFQFPKDDEVEV